MSWPEFDRRKWGEVSASDLVLMRRLNSTANMSQLLSMDRHELIACHHACGEVYGDACAIVDGNTLGRAQLIFAILRARTEFVRRVRAQDRRRVNGGPTV